MNTLTKRLALLVTGLTLCGASLMAQAPAPAPTQGQSQAQPVQKKAAKKAHRARKGVAKTSTHKRHRGTRKNAKPAAQAQTQAAAKS